MIRLGINLVIWAMFGTVGIFYLLHHPELREEIKKFFTTKQEKALPPDAGKPGTEKLIAPSDKQAPLVVKALKMTPIDFEDQLTIMGTIKGEHEVNLSFETEGTIKNFDVKEGEFVEKDQTIARLDSAELKLKFDHAQAKFDETAVDFQLAKQKLMNLQKLFQMGGASKDRVEEGRFEMKKIQKQMAAAQFEMQYSQKALDKISLNAPFAGVLLETNVNAGENITTNTLIGKFSLIDDVFAEVGVIERDLTKIKADQTCTLYVDAYPAQKFEGKVEVIAPMISGESRTATIKVRISNHDHKLLPGMFAKGAVVIYAQQHALIIPREAVVERGQGRFVYKLTSKTEAQLTAIESGYENLSYVLVDKGLQEGDFVVVNGLRDATEEKVVVEVKELSELSL